MAPTLAILCQDLHDSHRISSGIGSLEFGGDAEGGGFCFGDVRDGGIGLEVGKWVGGGE